MPVPELMHPLLANKWNLPLLLLTVLASLVFYPGLAGPFVFDDFPNIVHNRFLRFETLNLANLIQAALSSESGTLKRPLSMLSFALNAFFGGGTGSATAFKTWNLVFHILNSLLVFCFAYLVLATGKIRTIAANESNKLIGSKYLVPALIAMLWAVHPIQLTSVLYVVQRMNSLATLFVLLALISYLLGRRHFHDDFRKFLVLSLALPALFTVLGILSKENAILLPLFVLIIELTLFSGNPLWQGIGKHPLARYLLHPWIVVLVALVVVAGLALYFQPGYLNRQFSMWERLLTEARVICFYIYLIFLPRVSSFGLHHDDIEISQGLLAPPATLTSLVLLTIILFVSLRQRKKYPLLAFGVLFFLAGHLLESTLIPLEIAHEHRNYLPSFGLVFFVVFGITTIARNSSRPAVMLIVPLLIAFSATTTSVRAHHWSNPVLLYSKEVIHHPGSIRSLIEFSGILNQLGRTKAAAETIRHAVSLQPENPVLLIELLKYPEHLNTDADKIYENIIRNLKRVPLSPFLRLQLESVLGCLESRCAHLLKPYEQWLTTIVNRENLRTIDGSYYLYLLAKTYVIQQQWNQAVVALRVSASLDKKYAQPRFLLFSIYLSSGRLTEAETILEDIERISLGGRFKWLEEIAKSRIQLEKATVKTAKPIPAG